jgi:hypothetical protein
MKNDLDVSDFARLECVIASGIDQVRPVISVILSISQRDLTTCTEVLRALEEVRDRRLYRAVNASFEAYCREKWGLDYSKRQLDRLIETAPVAEAARPRGLRITEKAARDILDQVKADPDTPPADKLEELLDAAQAEIEAAEAQAASDAPSLERPERDRLEMIRKKLIAARKLIDGSIDFADRLEVAINQALEVLASCQVVQALAA